MERPALNELIYKIIGAAIEVHHRLGPGLLESAYEACLSFELGQMGLKVERQKALPVIYKEIRLEQGYHLDLLIEDAVIVELKTVDQLTNVHEAQVLSYLKLSGCPLGLLINFNVRMLKHGLRRYIRTQPG